MQRHVYSPQGKLRTEFSSLIDISGLNILSITGVAGSGKTTSLLRLGFDAADAGQTVLRLAPDWDLRGGSVAAQILAVVIETEQPVVVLIDDAADLVFKRDIFESTIRELRHGCGGKTIVIVCAEETNTWLATTRRAPSLAIAKSVPIHHLMPSECELLVDTILSLEEQEKLSVMTSASRDERLALCETPARRQLLVAMLQMRHGEHFHTIIRREFGRIPSSSAQQAYALICLLHSMSFPVPKAAIWKAVGVSTGAQVTQFMDATEGLILVDSMKYVARHLVIARSVVNHAYPTPEGRKAAIVEVLAGLDPAEPMQTAFLQDFFTRRNAYRNLAVLLGRKKEIIEDLYKTVRSLLTRWPETYGKFVAAAEGMTWKLLREVTRARDCFVEAEEVDPEYEFVLRQHAWLEHDEGNWDRAGKLAHRAAAIGPEQFETVYQCGLILALSTLRNFRLARPYLQQATALEPAHKKCAETWEAYCESEIIINNLRELTEEELIPDSLLEGFRPGLTFVRARFGPRSEQFRKKLWGRLKNMQGNVRGDLAELYETISGFAPGPNKNDNALIFCHIARFTMVSQP